MPTRDDFACVGHILDAIRLIEKFTQGMDEARFLEAEMAQSAVIRKLEIIGEAARKMRDESRAQYPDLPWSDVIGMRNKLIHDYEGVDLELVWRTITHDLPMLKASLTKKV